MVNQHALVLADDLSISRLQNKHLWLYLYFYHPHNKLFYQDGKAAPNNFTLQAIIITISKLTGKYLWVYLQ